MDGLHLVEDIGIVAKLIRGFAPFCLIHPQIVRGLCLCRQPVIVKIGLKLGNVGPRPLQSGIKRSFRKIIDLALPLITSQEGELDRALQNFPLVFFLKPGIQPLGLRRDVFSARRSRDPGAPCLNCRLRRLWRPHTVTGCQHKQGRQSGERDQVLLHGSRSPKPKFIVKR